MANPLLSFDHAAIKATEDRFIRAIAGHTADEMRSTTDDLKGVWRDRITGAGFSTRLANAIRGIGFPRHGGALSPAGIVYAQPAKNGRGAAAIVDSFIKGATIAPRNGRFLWIPSEDCPRKRNGEAFSPEEVEGKFGRRLQVISPSDRGFHTPSVRRGAVGFAVIKGLVTRKATGRWRDATANERAGKTRFPRPLQSVIMFYLVPRAKMPQRLDDFEGTAQDAMRGFEGRLAGRIRQSNLGRI
jgi:hypothetical protein